jgi:hypothetical protein
MTEAMNIRRPKGLNRIAKIIFIASVMSLDWRFFLFRPFGVLIFIASVMSLDWRFFLFKLFGVLIFNRIAKISSPTT